MNDAEKIVRDFYDNYGWVGTNGRLGEDVAFRQFSPPYYPYHWGTIARTVACFSGLKGKLLIAGGGDLPESHLAIAETFEEVCCLDISYKALRIARGKLRQNATCILGSILSVPYSENAFDAVLCAHVVYHIDLQSQERAIDELIRVTRKGGRIVVIYANPDSLIDRIVRRKNRTPYLWRLRRRAASPPPGNDVTSVMRPPLYYAVHPLNWWNRFQSRCDVTVLPWDVMGSSDERELLWSDGVARAVYRFCGWVENRHPALAAKWWQYPMIVLDKHGTQ